MFIVAFGVAIRLLRARGLLERMREQLVGCHVLPACGSSPAATVQHGGHLVVARQRAQHVLPNA
jgi:hypothetical protein